MIATCGAGTWNRLIRMNELSERVCLQWGYFRSAARRPAVYTLRRQRCMMAHFPRGRCAGACECARLFVHAAAA